MTHLKRFGLRLRLTFAAVLKYLEYLHHISEPWSCWSRRRVIAGVLWFDLERKQMTTLLFPHINMPRYYLAQLPHRDRVIVAIGRRLTGSPI